MAHCKHSWRQANMPIEGLYFYCINCLEFSSTDLNFFIENIPANSSEEVVEAVVIEDAAATPGQATHSVNISVESPLAVEN